MKLTVSLSKAYDALTDEESAKFHAWFGKSVVRDSKGKPIRCFHGTPHQFDKFDLNFAAKGNDQYGIGFYFTDNADVASTYSGENGSVMPCYLKIVKPIDFDRPRNITQLQITKLVSAIGPKLMKGALANHIDVDSVGLRVALNQYAKFYEGTDLLQAARGIWNDIYEGTPLAGHSPKLFKAVTGYDGIIVRRSNGNIYTWCLRHSKSNPPWVTTGVIHAPPSLHGNHQPTRTTIVDINRGAPTKENEDAISLLQKFSLELEAAAYDFMRAADFMQGHSLAIAQRLNTQQVG